MEIRSFPRPRRTGNEDVAGFGTPKLPPTVKDARWVGRRKKRRRSRNKGNNLIFIRTVVLSVVTLVGLALFMVAAFMRERKSDDNRWTNAAAVVRPPARIASTRREFPVPNVKEVTALVKNVLRMRKPEEFRDSIRLKDMSEAEAVDFLTHYDERDGGIGNVIWKGPMSANGIQIEEVEVMAKGEGIAPRVALLTPDADGVWQFDLAAFARKGSVEWDSFSASDEGEGEVRVLIAAQNYYNGIYRDERAWTCFEVSSPGSQDGMLGYCAKGSAAERALLKLLHDSPNPRLRIPVILRLKKTKEGEKRQSEILSVLAENWILTDVPFDEGFQEKPSP